MKKYDIIVIGSGAGSIISEYAVDHGMKVALVDKGPLGGTCLNVGCIPSKIMIFPADRIMEIRDSGKLGITTTIKRIDFSKIMNRMRKIVQDEVDGIRKDLKQIPNLDLYEQQASFIDNYTIEVGDQRIRGKKIFIASGARPLIPKIKGIDKVDYLTNESVMQLTKKPESLIVVGGGYIATEFAHFFSAMGTDVTIIQRGDRLLQGVEPEISKLLLKEMRSRMKIELNTEVIEASHRKGGISVIGKSNLDKGEKEFRAEKILIAAGRKSNSDILNVEKTGIKTDKKGFIAVNDYLETSVKNILAIGDANGKQMFRHTANVEAELAWSNSVHEHKEKMDYKATPFAVFTHPQIASVGMTEEEAHLNHEILVGRVNYNEVAKGEAMMENRAFAKAIVEKETFKILGFHIAGPYAPILIQEVVYAMANDLDIYSLGRAMHIHPALSEVVISAFGNLKEA